MSPLNNKCRKSYLGVSLVEALVALVVISIGMLGVAALHVESLRSSRTAILRSQAVILVGDIADRIRSNATTGISDQYIDVTITAADVNTNCEPGGAGCTPTELARHDKALWLTELADKLPGGTGTITTAGGTPTTYTIRATWTEQGTDQEYQLVMQAGQS